MTSVTPVTALIGTVMPLGHVTCRVQVDVEAPTLAIVALRRRGLIVSLCRARAPTQAQMSLGAALSLIDIQLIVLRPRP